jgi:hypothetical protein
LVDIAGEACFEKKGLRGETVLWREANSGSYWVHTPAGRIYIDEDDPDEESSVIHFLNA